MSQSVHVYQRAHLKALNTIALTHCITNAYKSNPPIAYGVISFQNKSINERSNLF